MNQDNSRAHSAGPQPPRSDAPRPNGAHRPPPYAPAPRRRDSLPGLGMLVAIGVLIVCAGVALQMLWPNGFPLGNTRSATDATKAPSSVTEIYSAGPLRINEVMSGNSNTLSIADGSSPDWVEVANVSDSTVSLNGWSLAKSANSANVFRFPDMNLSAGQCVLVYCDSTLRAETTADLHAPFRISSAGDTLILFNAAGSAVDSLNIPALNKDISYARVDTARWQLSETPTPGALNTPENYAALSEVSADSPVVINELMALNKTVLADANGMYSDYIELYNRSGAEVDLNGWYLSNDAAKPRKWHMPEVTLAPGQYLVVFASGLNRTEDVSQLNTNFSLSAEKGTVQLTNAMGQVMDRVSYDLLKNDQALSRAADGTYTTAAAPSPGSANE